MMPNRQTIHISALFGEQEDEIPGATCGDQIRVRIRGVEEEDILPVSKLYGYTSLNLILTMHM